MAALSPARMASNIASTTAITAASSPSWAAAGAGDRRHGHEHYECHRHTGHRLSSVEWIGGRPGAAALP